MSPLDARLKYCSLLIFTLIRLLRVKPDLNLEFSSSKPSDIISTKLNKNSKTTSNQAMERANYLNMGKK